MPNHPLANNIRILGPYIITYDISIKAEFFSCSDYNGITFLMDDGRYEIVNNYHMGPRLLINPREGGFRDIPLKPETFMFLPPGIQICLSTEERYNDA